MTNGKLVRWLHLAHRWLGIVLGLMVLLWFLSGLVMLFVARPQLNEAERLAGLPVFDAGSVHVSPATAWQALGLPGEPAAIRLNAADGRAAYRILANQQWYAVDAKNAQILLPAATSNARNLVQTYARQSEIINITTVDIDQWTVYRRFEALRPFWRVELADGRDLYISTRSGELALDTTTSERVWNWLGSVVHWVYITPLRQNTPLWRNLILWGSFFALILTASGICLGWQRLRLRNPYSEGRFTPYRTSWKRWHHLLGLCGGIVVLSWLFSGWLSLAPLGVAAGPKKPINTAPLLISELALRPLSSATTREIEWLPLGASLVQIEKQADSSQISLDGRAASAALPLTDIESTVSGMNLGRIKHSAWLNESDSRYFGLRHHPRTFPVARFELDDADQTVLYISPHSGRIEVVSNRHDFAHRWLYQGLHRFDLPVLVDYPLLRDLVIIALSLLGIALSLTGSVLGWRRIFNNQTGVTTS